MGYIQKTIVLALFLLCCLISFSQNNNKYDQLWKKADSLSQQKRLPASALKEVEKIYQLAKNENNDAQLIKALIARAELQQLTEEDAEEKSIALFEAEIKTTKEPAASILNSIVADIYWSYFQRNRWKFYNRTPTTAGAGKMENWSIDDFHKIITSKFLASLKIEALLQQVKLERYEPIIIKGNSRQLRPTLFDLLAHRAISYFRNEERDIIRPAYAFYIDNPIVFAEADRFINYDFKTADTLSLQHKALQLYQRILRFHAKDSDPSAFIDADIHRIEFARTYGQLDNKDSLYLSALETITKKYPDYKLAADAYYRIAEWHFQQGAKYDAHTDTSYRYHFVKAKEIAEKILQFNKENEAATNSNTLLNNINARQLALFTEKINIPGQPFRTLVNFKNISKLYLRILTVTDALKEQLRNRYDDNYWQRLSTLPALKTWSQDLPATNDYQQHAVEIKIDELPAGNYVLLAADNQQFEIKGKVIAAQHFYVSNISYVNNGTDYFLLHRETGKPLANATVQVWNEAYDYTARRQVLNAAEKLKADEHGLVRVVPRQKPNTNIRLEILYNNEKFFPEENYYDQYNERAIRDNRPETNSRVFFFTDRSIYRPGQQMHFKGIVVSGDPTSKKNKILTGYESTVKLYNMNNEVVDSLRLTTNEFGSYSGSFRIPERGLNGGYRIRDDKLSSETYFSVEEYKRPKFYISYEEITGSYKLNDSVRVTGLAKAYAGNNLARTVVSYTIIREARLLYPWLRGKWGFPRSTRVNIANGTATTDEDGRFNISFKAIPDRSIDTSLQPVFDYKIIATITDLNGETRTGEKIIPVSYKALKLAVVIPGGNTSPIDSLNNILVTSQNMNNQPEAAKVTLKVYKLNSPNRLIRKRYWAQPDLYVMSRAEFLAHFPHDEYSQESEVQNWEKGEMVFELTDSSNRAAGFPVNRSAFTEGWYVAEVITKDKYGEEVKLLSYFNLYNTQANLAMPVYSWAAQTKQQLQPGEQTLIGIGSAANDLFVVQHIDREMNRDIYMLPAAEQSPEQYNYFTLTQGKKWIPFTAREEDKGGFGVFHFFVKDNRFYILSNTVAVPWSDKMLSVSYETFRDKTLPGSEEKWKMRISGLKKEKLAAEMLASMYDASLDQFLPHNWTEPSIWPVYQLNTPWTWMFSFSAVEAYQRYIETSSPRSYTKTYDWFISGDRGHLTGRAAEEMMKRMPSVAVAPAADAAMESNKVGATAMRMQKTANQATASTSTEEAQQSAATEAVPAVQLRSNFQETAFFFPDLKTDAEGNIEFSFTIPEALTRWKLQAVAHTKELALGLSNKEIITQKELMVQPNAPRFLREGDRIELSTKIVNLGTKEITGTVQLELLNAATQQPVDGWFQNAVPNQYFTVEAGRSAIANFRIEVPYQYNEAVIYRFIAKSGQNVNGQIALSDGEESILPVLTNSMLVTESMPLPLTASGVKNFRFEKLLNASGSETLKHHAVTVEFTSNPAWYAVQALPYLAVPRYESADHFFNKFYANALAFKIANATPRIREIFERWKLADTAALLSNLQKNEELKSILLEETPWVLQAKNETEQKKNIALLFDINKMGTELAVSLAQLREMQSPNGGFMWFKGGPDDRQITQYIIANFGRLQKLQALPAKEKQTIDEIISAGVKYLDDRIRHDYTQLLKQPKTDLTKNRLGNTQVHYLYMRSFFNDIPVPGNAFTAVNYYRKQSQQFWTQFNRYAQGMIALSLHRTGDKAKAAEILRSLNEHSLYNEELGRYWKDNVSGYYWYQAPVTTQVLLIEAFGEIGNNAKTINELKTWLLKQKQTQNWKTPKATADACYALLMQIPGGMNPSTGGTSSWLSAEPSVDIVLGNKTIRSIEEKEQAGTGYFKKTFNSNAINAEMGNISVTVNKPAATETVPSWGAVYWQYFERLDKITHASTPLQLQKRLFVESASDRGPVLQPVLEGQLLKTGDKMKVRIELKVDRDMEYIHMKDMRASCMEPVNVLSGYKWQGGLGYYETTKDASTSFFFHWLPKGSYVFEYPLFVTQAGNFSNGVTSIESMYAPEFSSHSEGVRVNVE